MARRLSALICLALLPALAFAAGPFKDQGNSSLSGIMLDPTFSLNTGVAPLLDPSRMQWSHQVSYGVSSGSGGSLGQGLFMNTLDYRIGAKTSMRLHLGMVNTTFNSWNPESVGNQAVGGAEFRWQPKDNVYFEVGVFQGMTPDRDPYGSRLHPWGSRW